MTRRKKTRSLKRIHSVKTGNAAKLKRAAGADRQSSKSTKNRTLSVYEKFLQDNPEAKAAHVREMDKKTPKKTDAEHERNEDTTEKNTLKKTPTSSTPSVSESDNTPKSLLDQLDNKDFKDIY